MDMNNPQGTGEQGQTQNTSPQSEGNAGDAMAKVQELENAISAIKDQQQKQSAFFGKLDNRLGQLDKLLEQKREDPHPNQQEQQSQASGEMTSLAQQFQQLKAQQEQQAEFAKRQRITEALVASGVDTATASQGAKWIALEEGSNINATFSNGEFVVTHGADDINSFVQGYLETPAGSLLKPKPVGPTPNAPRGSVAGQTQQKQKISSVEFGQLLANTPRDQRKTLADKYEIVG